MKTIALFKGGHSHLFVYESGQDEQVVVEALIQKCKDGDIDWFDAAVLSHQLGLEYAELTKTLKDHWRRTSH